MRYNFTMKWKILSCVIIVGTILLFACSGTGGDSAGGGGGEDQLPSPTVTDSITLSAFSVGSSTEMTINWTAASDDSGGTLSYKVVKASASTSAAASALIDTVEEAQALTRSDIVLDWTENVTTATASNLAAGSFNALAVLVRNQSRGVSIYPPLVKFGGYVIYLTALGSTYDGQVELQMGEVSLATADAKCMDAANLPHNILSAKALLGGNGRTAASVLKPSAAYFQYTGPSVGVTNSSSIPTGDWVWPGDDQTFFWSGFNADFSVAVVNLCTDGFNRDWAIANPLGTGRRGYTDSSGKIDFSVVNIDCTAMTRLFCVEQ